MLLLPPCLFLAVLGTLHVFVSANYVPGFFPIGIVFPILWLSAGVSVGTLPCGVLLFMTAASLATNRYLREPGLWLTCAMVAMFTGVGFGTLLYGLIRELANGQVRQSPAEVASWVIR